MSRIIYELDGVSYEKSGWFGCQLKSVESRVKRGTTRVIKGHLMYAYAVERKSWYSFKYIISWCLVFPRGQDLEETRTMIENLYYDIER
jgi:hypothetical protein